MLNRKNVTGLTFALVLFVSLLFFWSNASAQDYKPILVGHLGEWTGPVGRTAGPPGDAFIAYLERYVNEEKGGIPYKDPATGKVLGRVKVKVLFADCRYELPLFKSAYRKFVDKGIVLVHSTASPALEGLKRDFARDKIPCLQTSSNSVAHWPPGWVYGQRGSFADDMGTNINYILANWKEKRAPRVALVYYDGPLGKSMLWGGPQYAEEKGVEIVAKEPIAGGAIDTTSQLLRIKQAKADFILGTIVGSQAAVVLKDMKRLGMDIPLMLGTGTDATELVELAGDVAKGTYYTWITREIDDSDDPAMSELHKWYSKYMRGKKGYDVDKRGYPDGVWLVGWIVGSIAEEALRLALEEVAPDELTGEKVRDFGINRIKNFTCNGLLRDVSYDKPGVDHRGSQWTVIHKVGDDLTDTAVTDFMKAPTILPSWMK